MNIHPTAVIHPSASIAAEAVIGAYAIIEESVTIGKGTSIGAHTVIGKWTEIGENNQIFHLASVGVASQDLKYKGEECWTRIGNNNMVREFATIHRGTVTGNSETLIGSNNLFMAYSHIAHDCIVGNGNVFANSATLAGHVTVQDNVILGGLTAVHQFATIGSFSMLGGGTLVGLDIPPYMIATAGKRDAKLRGLNLIGLKRRGFSDVSINGLKKAYKILFMSDLRQDEAIAKVKAEISGCPEVDNLLDFIEKSERGICKG
ncbi:MAG: acyl-ACP--UDP-N-acetylglucosamine O-acyltransferase [Trichlorobacter sp.]|nr:acyl-ACP--UDP-N-acetylglucosamine O-acyltransferase [Trichlorobacter sp.]